MRRLASTTALVLAASALLAAPADAMREDGAPGRRSRQALVPDRRGRLRQRPPRPLRHLHQRPAAPERHQRKTLPFDVTAWGYYDSSGTEKRNTLRLNVIAADGVPRSLVLKRTQHSLKVGKVRKYQQRSFKPRLYADGGTFYAYTLNGSTMKRWSLTRFRDGDVRFARPTKVGRFAGLTSLQAASFAKVHGVESELLYATTSRGQLLQIVVPFDHPNRARVHKLAKAGYEGVTEMAWSMCNGQRDYHTLIAIDPVGNRATWTTIKNAFTRPKAKLRGDVTGVTDWNLSAGF